MLRYFIYSLLIHFIIVILSCIGWKYNSPKIKKDFSKMHFHTVGLVNNLSTSITKSQTSTKNPVIKTDISSTISSPKNNKLETNTTQVKKIEINKIKVLPKTEKSQFDKKVESTKSSQRNTSENIQENKLVSNDDKKRGEKNIEKKPSENAKATEKINNEIKNDHDNNRIKNTDSIKPDISKDNILKNKAPKKVINIEQQTKDSTKDDLDQLLSSLTTSSKKNNNTESNAIDLALNDSSSNNDEYNEDLELTADEINSIKLQLSSKWFTTSFSGAAKTFSAKVKILIDINGNINSIDFIEQNALNNHLYSAFINSIRRAILDASPLVNLPVEKYEIWKEIYINFTPNGIY